MYINFVLYHAGRGAGHDYTLTNSMVYITRTRIDSATVIIRLDNIALEQNETFQLRLEAKSLPSGHNFFIDTLDVVIQDSDCKGNESREDQ